MPDATPRSRPTQSDRDRTRFVTGAGRYLADLDAEGALHAVFLRSPHAHARIEAMDCAVAEAMPGVVRVLTAADCREAGFGNFRALMRYRNKRGEGLVAPFRPVLAGERVRHVGEPVACVVATSRAAAEDAAEAINVDYAILPPVIGLDAAKAKGAPILHEDAPGNLAFDYSAGDAARVRAALAEAARVIEDRIELPKLAPNPMEPRGALGRYDAAGGRYRLITQHQGINEIRADLAAVLNAPAEAIEIDLPDVGGAFGARGAAYPEHAAVLLAAKLTGHPVRWMATRSESFLIDHYGRSTRLSGRLALDREGRFTALDVHYETDLGAYVTTVGAFVNLHNPMQTLGGTYAIAALHGRFTQYFTNTGPLGPYRGAGRPDIALLIERLVDRASAAIGIDPIALRRLNAIPAGAFPYRTPMGATYDSADYASLLDAARAASDWGGFAARQGASASAGKLRGRGLALFTEVAGGGATDRDEARITLGIDQDRVTAQIETITGGSGQSHAETYAFIAAKRLGIDPADIVLEASLPGSRLAGVGSIASRSTQSAGNAIASAAEALCARLLRQAGLRANAPPEELGIEGGMITRHGEAVASLAETLAALGGSLTELGAMPFSHSFPSGCHVAEVEIDRETGHPALVSYVAVDDAGNIVNHVAAEAQIHGGIAQGFGEVFGEAMRYDETGQPLTGSFMDYAMPHADDLPDFTVLDRPVPSPHNPLGVKGLGEAGTTGALCATANAIADALRSIGAEMPDLPCTPLGLWDAIMAAKSDG
ncbi:MAG TPA: xanthine dehydrogenase family protein molybdopterin-binding subunit [Acetobacteraceae bacterium]|nr:xanthine dehydrogenase family protein molybdopterin-binding subunit [Acetobacteraceae bacterium]